MGRIGLLGMNHKSAPVEIREQLALACRGEAHPLQALPRLECVGELFALSTCNRVELLFTCETLDPAVRELKAVLLSHLGHAGASHLDQYFYLHQDIDAVEHLFRVASSLDSMVVGEPQILGQIKAAYREATEYRTVGVILNRLLHKSFSVAKRVRSETRIGSLAVSISYAAVELARKIFGDLREKRILLIGAGEMAELAAEHLRAQGVRRMFVANRTVERAIELARQFKADSIPFSHILDTLKSVDIVISSTGSTEPILTHGDIKSRMRERRNRPLFFIDIAVPRDVESRVNEIDNVYLYDIDDLKGIVELNKEERQREAERAHHIIAEEALKFTRWLSTLDVVPTIVALRRKAEIIRQNELNKTLSHLPHFSEKDRQAIVLLTESIVKKLLHNPIVFLKKKSDRDSKQQVMDFAQQLFNLTDGAELNGSTLEVEEASYQGDLEAFKFSEK
ncbi:MAG: glutamyl-tRNA reductase [Syntrophobacteraceae bacterium]|jgi:glutamyl-tRNA reductase|nr:glutamyl-tRNA reductase [Syntrophobacteraceae bacterium]